MHLPPLTWVPRLTLGALVLPVAAGLAGVLAPVLGVVMLDGQITGNPLAHLMRWGGLATAMRLSLVTGLVSTLLSLGLVVLILSMLQGTRGLAWMRRVLSPLLSVPHAAAAFGLAFLIAPSGWVARALSPWATGWVRPPDVLILNDPWGLALIIGLTVKEMPFLLLMALAALPQVAPARSLLIARSLGHGGPAAWIKTVFPRVYDQIRLPVYVVLAYGMTTVDVALILGPATPPPLSVQILRWMSDPDLSLRLLGAAGALVQLALVGAALLAWRAGEMAIARWGCRWIMTGRRDRWLARARPLAYGLAVLSAGAVLAGLAGLLLWSFAGLWSFPAALPDQVTPRSWLRFLPQMGGPVAETALIAAVSTVIALALCIGCLEAETRHDLRPTKTAMTLLYLPLLVPQIAFLPGLQVLLIGAGLSVGRGAVIAAHLVFVLPYVFLSLSDPWRAWNGRYGTVARALGAGKGAVLWRVRLPMLLAPVLTAAAVGFAVSVGQYLPTLLAGGGRIQTLTTEAVALASGGDRRAIGVYGVAQTGAALLPFVLAILVPRLIWANRRGMRED